MMLKIILRGQFGRRAGPLSRTRCHWRTGPAEGTGLLRVGVDYSRVARNSEDETPLLETPRSVPLGSCEQVNCPDLMLWQHEGKTGGRPPPRHGCEGSKLFQARP